MGMAHTAHMQNMGNFIMILRVFDVQHMRLRVETTAMNVAKLWWAWQ